MAVSEILGQPHDGGLHSRRPIHGHWWRLALLFLILAATVASMFYLRPIRLEPTPPQTSMLSAPVWNTLTPGEGFRTAARLATPAVVSIVSSKTTRVTEDSIDPFWRNFFGRDWDVPKQYRERGLGSGVIVTSDGLILTNEHVVHGASDIRVMLADKREYKAKLTGADPKTDLAVLKVDAKNLPTLALSDSSKIAVGDIVLAIGNPFGIGQSVTMGIVSAMARSGVVDPDKYEDFIQTDAAINPGNSGGALVTTHGDLIAINTAIITRSGGNQGIGFAVPSNVAQHVMSHILKDGRVVRGWLGVNIQPVGDATARAFGLKTPGGALVGGVTPGSPAEKAGIVRGDVILELNGQRLEDSAELRAKISIADPGTTVNLKLFRDGKERVVSATLGELREQNQQPYSARPEPEMPLLEGLSLTGLTPGAIRELSLPRGVTGVLVTRVEQGTPAADAGLRQGDVIVEVNRRAVTTVDQARAAFRSAGNAPVLLFINRRGATLYTVLEQR